MVHKSFDLARLYLRKELFAQSVSNRPVKLLQELLHFVDVFSLDELNLDQLLQAWGSDLKKRDELFASHKRSHITLIAILTRYLPCLILDLLLDSSVQESATFLLKLDELFEFISDELRRSFLFSTTFLLVFQAAARVAFEVDPFPVLILEQDHALVHTFECFPD